MYKFGGILVYVYMKISKFLFVLPFYVIRNGASAFCCHIH